jgi:hypothetical protein
MNFLEVFVSNNLINNYNDDDDDDDKGMIKTNAFVFEY